MISFFFNSLRVQQVTSGVSVCSYNGHVTIGFTCDEKTVPDGKLIVELMNQEFDAYLKEIQ